MGSSQTLDPRTALALYLPRSQALFRDLSNGMINLPRLEEDIAKRDHFHGVLEFTTDMDGVQVLYADGIRSAILLTPGVATRVRQFDDLSALEANVGLYTLDPALTRIATRFSTAQPSDLSRAIQRVGFEQTFGLLTDSGSSGVLHLLSTEARAQVFLDEGRVVHAQLIAPGVHPDQPVSLEQMYMTFGSSDVHGVIYQTQEPLRPLNLQEREPTPTPAPTSGPVAEPAFNPRAILEGWSDLMRRTRTLAEQKGNTTFDRSWRAAGVALCELHPLLDPFSADLTWADGSLSLHSDSSEGLLEALEAGFTQTIATLRLPLEQVLIGVKLIELGRKHTEAGLERLLPGGRKFA
jgi:hypothetical protein